MKRRALVACALVMLGLSASSPARADDAAAAADPAAEARAQYQLGTQAFQAKKYAEAALHFESAAAFRPHAVALYTAGLAWDLANKPERAADAFARSLDVPGLDPKQTSTAKERVAALEKTLGTLAVRGAEGMVQLDTMTEAPLPARLHASAGAHALSVRIPGRPIDRRDVELEAGKVTELDLSREVKPAVETAEPPVEPASPSPGEPVDRGPRDGFWTIRRVAGVGVAGLGVAVLGAGVVLGLSANGAKDAYDAAPTREAFDHASGLQTWTNVALITGAAALASGIVLVVLPDGDSGEVRMRMGIGPNGAALGGTF